MNCPIEYGDREQTKSGRLSQLLYFKSRRDEPPVRGQSGTPLHGTVSKSWSALRKSLASLPLVASSLVPACLLLLLLLATSTHFDTRNRPCQA